LVPHPAMILTDSPAGHAVSERRDFSFENHIMKHVRTI
jgi:hypothetical protein